MALQNVRSFGTEGRDKIDPSTTFVPAQDTVHPYLVFRGCDIKDLHVHEEPPMELDQAKTEPELPAPPTILPTTVTPPLPPAPTATATAVEPEEGPTNRTKKPQRPRTTNSNSNNKKPMSQIGTGASLLNRKERGAVTEAAPTPQDDFDFESMTKFEDNDDVGDDDDGAAYAKDDFFDSISCDAIDKQNGVDNRLRGATERTLNTETFGAVALNSQRRRRNNRSAGGRGDGRGAGGRREGRGDGAGGRGEGGRGGGRGRGRGRGGRGGGRRSTGDSNSDSWRDSNIPSRQQTTASSS